MRSYKTEPQIWGGREDCEHEWGKIIIETREKWGHGPQRVGDNPCPRSESIHIKEKLQSQFCIHCSAWRGELGLEPTIELYVQHIVEIFRELRRILRDDGTLWLNMGDSYSGSCRGSDAKYANKELSADSLAVKPDWSISGLKPKDLCGIPWRVAFALQADGWWLRSDLPQKQLWVCPCGCGYAMILYRQWDGDIIWEKQNPMPESCTDRPTRSHEYIFLLTKSGTSQYWTHRDLNGVRKRPKADYRWMDDITKEETDVKPDGWTIKNKMGCNRVNLWDGHDYYYDADAVRERALNTGHSKGNKLHPPIEDAGIGHKDWHKYTPDSITPDGSRNLRTVWTFATQPFPEAHFATFPEELVRRCILAGTAEQACPTCGAAWERVTEKKRLSRPELDPDDPRYRPNRYDGAHGEFKGEMGADCGYTESKTLGFRPTCKCPDNDGSGRCVVLDPFMGSGTVAYVALKLGRDYIGCELKPEYIKMIEKRLKPLGNKPCPQQVEAL